MLKNRTVKALSLLFALIAAVSVCSCDHGVGGGEGVSIVAVNFPSYDFARQIAGERAQITLLVPPGSDDHSYEPSPSDLVTVGRCDLLIYTGGTSDGWVDDMCASFGGEGINTLKMTECTELLPAHDAEEHTGDHDHDGDLAAEEYDEHVWTSLRCAGDVCVRIADELARIDPDGAQEYRANCEKYTEQLSLLDAEFTTLVEGVENNTLVFGDRFPFRYFVRDYKITYYAAFPGCSSQTEPDVKTVMSLVDRVRAEGISTVFYVDLSNSATAYSIAEETGASVACLYSCHTITKEQLDADESYLSLMRKNLETLKAAYGK